MLGKKKLLTKLEEIDHSVGEEKHQTDTLYSRAFTFKVNAWLETLNEDDKGDALNYLQSPHSEFEYHNETHDYSIEPFDSDGQCYHGLTADTCPCGCGEL